MSQDTENEMAEENTEEHPVPESANEEAPADVDSAEVDEEEGGDEPLFGPEASDEELDLLSGEGGDRVAELEVELAEVKDQLLRAVAETENVRRRAQRDKTDAGKYGIASFAREMLSVADNLRRALDSERVDEEKQANADLNAEELLERFGNFILGVTMTEKEMHKTLERIGIRKIEPIGEPFDPKLHHAMFELEDLDQPTGTVMQVIESGYVLHDRLLREAKVGVSKGGPKLEASEPAQESDPGEAEGAAQAYEQSSGTGGNVDKEL
jgi:molecular chaperone GrpE